MISTLIRLNVPLNLFTTWDEIKHVHPLTDECDDTEEDGVDAEKMDSLSTFEILGYTFKSKRRYINVIVSNAFPILIIQSIYIT